MMVAVDAEIDFISSERIKECITQIILWYVQPLFKKRVFVYFISFII